MYPRLWSFLTISGSTRAPRAPDVAGLRGVVLQLAELEPVVRHHHERRATVHGGQHAAEDLVRVDVHLLDGPSVFPLLLRELAGEVLCAEEVAEQVRGRVEP